MKTFTKSAIGLIAVVLLSGVSFADHKGENHADKGFHLGTSADAPNVFLDFSASVERSQKLFFERKRKELDARKKERLSNTVSSHISRVRELAIEKAKERRGK